jgi:undecaprenyl-diphosphatase
MPIWFVVVLLGIIEGITEFLPVSSTGHLLIAEQWLPAQTDLFNVVIQCGAVVAVLPLFPERLRQFFFRWREPGTQDYLLKIFVAFAMTAAGGFILDKVILSKAGFKLDRELLPIAIALFVGGVLFILVEKWLKGKVHQSEITWSIVFAVGVGQLIAAIFPGASRSGTTILLALMLGLNRVAATEFSFLVGIPTMLAAGGWKILKALHHPAANAPHENWAMVALGTIIAAIVSFIAVKWLLRYVQTHTFVAFGWYRIAVAVLIAILILLGLTKPKPDATPLSAATAERTILWPPVLPVLMYPAPQRDVTRPG